MFTLISTSTVTLLGGQNCSTDEGDVTHADPGDIISINCEVDNPDGFSKVLVWTIDSFGVSVSNIECITDDGDADQPEFVSTVNSFNSTLLTTNAILFSKVLERHVFNYMYDFNSVFFLVSLLKLLYCHTSLLAYLS